MNIQELEMYLNIAEMPEEKQNMLIRAFCGHLSGGMTPESFILWDFEEIEDFIKDHRYYTLIVGRARRTGLYHWERMGLMALQAESEALSQYLSENSKSEEEEPENEAWASVFPKAQKPRKPAFNHSHYILQMRVRYGWGAKNSHKIKLEEVKKSKMEEDIENKIKQAA